MHSQTPSFARSSRILVALLAGMALAAPALGMTLRELRTLEKSEKQGEFYATYYLIGVMEGALEAHDQSVRSGAKPAICMNGRRLEPRMAKSLYDTELKRHDGVYEADMPVPLVMANALATVYPC